MIKKADTLTTQYNEHMRGGDGTVELTNFIVPAELNDKGRMFGKVVLHPGCGIGYHEHHGESELFYILKGTPDYSDNGEVIRVSAGDVTICPSGTGHAVTNNTDEDVELIAVILNA